MNLNFRQMMQTLFLSEDISIKEKKLVKKFIKSASNRKVGREELKSLMMEITKDESLIDDLIDLIFILRVNGFNRTGLEIASIEDPDLYGRIERKLNLRSIGLLD